MLDYNSDMKWWKIGVLLLILTVCNCRHMISFPGPSHPELLEQSPMPFLLFQLIYKTQYKYNMAMECVAPMWLVPSETPVRICLSLQRWWKVRPLRGDLVTLSNTCLPHRRRVVTVRVDYCKVCLASFALPHPTHCFYVTAAICFLPSMKIWRAPHQSLLLDYQNCEPKRLHFFISYSI